MGKNDAAIFPMRRGSVGSEEKRMDSQIHQMQFNFSPFEDRLLFRFNTTMGEEFSFWLTRRYVKLVWPALLEALGSFETAAPNRLIMDTLLSFQHETVMANADLATPFHETRDAQRPLGTAPVLLTKLTIRRSSNNLPILCMHPERGKGIELVVNQKLLHSFCGLLIQAVRNCGWDLQFEVGGVVQQPPRSKVSIN
jgi:hypothetical protein